MPVSYQKVMTPNLTEFGFIAQDVMTIFTNLVTTANDPSKTMSLGLDRSHRADHPGDAGDEGCE